MCCMMIVCCVCFKIQVDLCVDDCGLLSDAVCFVLYKSVRLCCYVLYDDVRFVVLLFVGVWLRLCVCF